jgi:hypothetical protein
VLASAALALCVAAACRAPALPAPVRPAAAVPRAPAPAAGRGTLVGMVVDSATGFPVWGALVYFTRDSVIGAGPATPRRDTPSDTTGRDGGFTLPDLAPGRYTLAFDGLDHYPLREVVIVRPGLVQSTVLRPRRRVAP